jgi:murein DD-endopeptidase MepM/ murein hydrolase activator NlpD
MTSYIQKFGQQLVVVLSGEKYLAQNTGGDVWLLNAAEAGPGPGEPPIPGVDKTFDWPFNPNTEVTSEYGPRNGRIHQGIDFGKGTAVEGASIHSSADGVVANDTGAYHSGWGWYCLLNHGVVGGRQLYTLYAHMLHVSPFNYGDDVVKGQPVGQVNNTGSSQGSHLHWETHIANPGQGISTSNPGTHVNPRTFMATYQNTTPPAE